MHSFTLALLLSQTNDLGGQQLCCSGYNSGHTVISLSSSSCLGSPLTSTLWPQLKVPSIHDQTYSSCESQGRGRDNQQCLQKSVAWRKNTTTLFRPTQQPQTTSWGTLHETAQNLWANPLWDGDPAGHWGCKGLGMLSPSLSAPAVPSAVPPQHVRASQKSGDMSPFDVPWIFNGNVNFRCPWDVRKVTQLKAMEASWCSQPHCIYFCMCCNTVSPHLVEADLIGAESDPHNRCRKGWHGVYCKHIRNYFTNLSFISGKSLALSNTLY